MDWVRYTNSFKGAIFFCHFFVFAGYAQNFVSNAGFEQYSICPDYVSQINYCNGWERPTEGTSDYFNACLGVPFSVSVPDNQFGVQQPSGGNGYAGLYAFYSTIAFTNAPEEDHEYITSMLTQPLQPGMTYYAEFKVSLSEASRYAVSDLGMLFSVAKPVRNDELAIQYIPQVTNVPSTPLTDKTGWTTISGCFVADSAYEFITIGNFKSGANTLFTNVGTQSSNLHYSYYYVDDIVVTAHAKPLIEAVPIACGPVTLNIANYNSNHQYLWSNGSSASSVIVSAGGNYSCSVFTGECWISSDTLEVFIPQPIYFSLGNDTSVNFCLTSDLILTPGIDSVFGYNFLWSTGATSMHIVVVSGGTYTLTVSDSYGCETVRSINITDACEGSIYIPNSFTPNNDGRNEEFHCYGSNIGLTEFSVYNRWGQIVFQTEDISDGWNGNNSPEGLYVWKAVYFKDESGRRAQIIDYGTVLLLR